MMVAKIGVRSFLRQRRRNSFTLIAVMIGSAGLITLGGFVNRWENTLTNSSIYVNQAGTYSVYKRDGLLLAKTRPKTHAFSLEEQNKLTSFFAGDPQVEYVGRLLTMQGLVSNGCSSYPFEIKGYEPELFTKLRNRPEVLKWCFEILGLGEGLPFSHYQNKAVVGVAKGLAKSLNKNKVIKNADAAAPLVTDFNAYCHAPDSKQKIATDANLQIMGVTLGGQFNASDVDIAHYYTTGTTVSDYSELTAPLSLVQNLYDTDRVSSLSIYMKSPQASEETARGLKDKIVKATGIDVDVYPWNNELISPVYRGIMDFIWMMGLFFSLLIGSAVILSVVNLTTISVLDRSREIGTLKALGFRTGSIAYIFLVESLLIGTVGSFAGLGLSLLTNAFINEMNIQYFPTGFSGSAQFWITPDPLISFSILLFVFLLVTLSSLIASYVLSKRSCLELLTHNGG
ncbi:MAG: ABC transporter permease [Chitinophagaceae bacterium]|nr:ABC transporter permease [Oligoflexus sp.]